MSDMKWQSIPVGDLKPAEYNPRKKLKAGDKEYEKIKNSILEFGYVEPIIVNYDMTVIGGHQRLTVLRDLGHTEVQCVVLEIKDDAKVKALNIALNKIAGEWDEKMLADLLVDIQAADFNTDFTGFEPPEIEQLFSKVHDKEIKDDDFDVDEALKEESISKQGDLWLLGKHRLVCGDSTIPETYEKLMDGKKANMILTDLPYNVDYEGTAGKIKNDNMGDKEFYEFLLKAYTNMFENIVDGGAIYVFHADRETVNFRSAFKEAGFFCHQTCIWVKNAPVLGRSDYLYAHEPVLYGWKPTASHKFYGDRKHKTIWNFDRPTKSKLHPTMKPLQLLAYPIKNSSLANCIVLDPFGGSGSTLISSDQTNRICYMIELDEKFVDVIVSRFVLHAGTSADVFLIRDGEKISYKDLKFEEAEAE